MARKQDFSGITDDPEMLKTLRSKSTLGKQASKSAPKRMDKAAEKAHLEAQWSRVDKSRAAKGKPSLPKPGSKAARGR